MLDRPRPRRRRADDAAVARSPSRRADARLSTLLTASYGFPEGGLFELYGLQQPAKQDLATPVALDREQRAGLLTQAGFLAVHAHQNQSAPVQRGRVVIRNISPAGPVMRFDVLVAPAPVAD